MKLRVIRGQRGQMSKIIYKELSFKIVGAAMEVHSTLGPGFLEAVYQSALAHELTLRGIPFEQFKQLKVVYKEKDSSSTLNRDQLLGRLRC